MPAQYIKRLPEVFQTVTERKFFEATFDQVFQKKESDLLSGFLGRRNPGQYNPITDFYLPEPSKNRTWWQLEPTAYARDADTNKTNIFFYEDLLEYIEYYGGNTLNQDRLFESQYYSFGPPIDYDMFLNYQNYYWVEEGLPAIPITVVQGTDIIGKSSFNTNEVPGATPEDLQLSSGMTIILLDDPLYSEPHVLENFGGCIGFQLVKKSSEITPGTIFEFLPWDGTIALSTGRTIDNRFWDMKAWEVQTQPGNGDYITIERGAIDQNAWSRTNKWIHISALNATISATGAGFPGNATRATRPIIQFVANIPLYNSGTQFKGIIDFGFKNNELGQPSTLAQFQGRSVFEINNTYNIELVNEDLIVWFDDVASNHSIWKTTISGSTASFTPFGTAVVEGDSILASEDAPYSGANPGESWYFSNNAWIKSTNQKTSTNQAPLFQLLDHNGVDLDNPQTYPESSFRGSKIFSYKINETPGATVDPVLKFPIVYTSLGQASDIVFENNLITDRYTYVSDTNVDPIPIDGYYYYDITTGEVIYNNWNLYDICDCEDIVPPPPTNCIEVSKQRVIDKFVVGYGVAFDFRLSVTPYGYVVGGGPVQPLADINVNVNGFEVKNEDTGFTFFDLNNRVYIRLARYLPRVIASSNGVAPVVEAQTYTHGLLNPEYPGYFEIPQQLEANPSQLEVGEVSAGELTQHFTSIIENQIGFEGIAFGGNNNYRDTRKNRSVGSFILQNVAPMLKSMLIASSDDLDFIKGVRFSADEYTKFKNRFLSTALQLINQGFSAFEIHKNTVDVSIWVGEILRRLNISKEFSNAFAYSFMAAQGTPAFSEDVNISVDGAFTLTNYIDLSDPRNVIYIYDITDPTNEHILTDEIDYKITSINNEIEITTTIGSGARKLLVTLYQNPLPTYIPSTPTKVGAWGAYIPRIELDTSYAIPTDVIIGHDGSKTIAYGDYRDVLLLDLETRIYNFLQPKYRNEYNIPLRIESIKSGYFRKTRYSREEFLEVTESYINKWTAKNRANYRVNDWPTSSPATPVDQLWKLYNYRSAVTTADEQVDLPGNWKGIFQYYYDTYYPDTRPWEMLGFSTEPEWWATEYGTDWGSGNTALWEDLEDGIIRQGSSAIYDPETLEPQPQEMWARPGLSEIIPVDAVGEIIPIIELFDLAYTGDPYFPFDHFDDPWVYGDGGPVEQAWMSTSLYAFSAQEFLYLMRPGPYGELMWDTLGTELSPGRIDPNDSNSPQSSTNWQYVQNDTFTYDTDPFFAWMRPKNKDQIVHAEIVDGVTQIRSGYQNWISDRILFLGKNIGDTFGQKVRTLDVNLANKLAGFVNKDTTTTNITAITPGSNTNTLIIPSNNFEIFLHKSPSVDTYSYSGIIIRVLANGTFVVYGYDLLNSEFITLDRKNDKLIDVSVGGTPAEFRYFEPGGTYKTGDIVRYNGIYYISKGTQNPQKFIPEAWDKLKTLPTVGGISVTYKPVSAETITRYPYGSILKTPQEVFDLMIGWGAWLEKQGWQFNEVSQDTNIINNWLTSAKQFLFWLNTSWAPDASIQLSPLANTATLIVKRGYPSDVETLSNGVYSILDKYGIAIPPNFTSTDREGPLISVSPTDLSAGGIYYLQINASETEHVIIFDNFTNFGDIIYTPLFRERQQRLRFNGFRSRGWYGKMEAPGYLIIENQLVPNYDTIVDAMRYFYDSNVTIDNTSLEDLGRSLIGYESKSYLDNLEVSNDVQYLFYQGVIRQKGTKQAFEKLFRSTKVQSEEIIKVYEEWALKLGDFGNTIEQVSTEFKLVPEQNTGEVIVARLNYVPSDVGFVKQVNILNARNTYINVPKILFSFPDATPPIWTNFNSSLDYSIGDVVKFGISYYKRKTVGNAGPFNIDDWDEFLILRVAKGYAVLDDTNRIARVDISDPGYGYLSAPNVTIDSGTELHNLDHLYAVWQGAIVRDESLDNIINIDIDDTNKWIVRPTDPLVALELPVTDKIDYTLPNAGYVHFDDVDFSIFGVEELVRVWGSLSFNPIGGDTIWVAKTFTQDWCVYKMLDISTESGFDVIAGAGDELYLRTPSSYLITPQFGGGLHETNFGNMIAMYVKEARATVTEIARTARGTIQTIVNAAAITTTVTNGVVTAITVTNPGFGYDEDMVVDIDPPVFEQATLSITLAPYSAEPGDGYTVNSVTITNPGKGYVSGTVTVTAPATIPVQDTAIITVTVVNGRIATATVVHGGSEYLTAQPPTATVSAPDGFPASAVAIASENKISTVTLSTSGGGYTFVPAVRIPAAENVGTIVNPVVTDGGVAYEKAPIVAVVGNGTGARVKAILEKGSVASLEIENPGTGYTTATLVFSPPEPGNGAITEITIDKSGAGYLVPPTISIIGNGTGASAIAYVAGGEVSEIVITNGGTGYTAATVTITNPPSIDGEKNYPLAFKFNQDETTNDPLYNYYNLITLDGIPILSTDIGNFSNFTNLMLFKTVRFWTENESLGHNWIVPGDKIWVDGVYETPPKWHVYDIVTPSLSYPLGHKPFRLQEKLLNTSLFESATVFNDEGRELIQLPVYDPFKYILPGPAKQNLTYVSLQDPARYNVTGEERLFSEIITFGEVQVGRLWWDLSNTRYVYYEQPKSLVTDPNAPGYESNVDNLVYRRDHWAEVFPGSLVGIYEWTKSPTPPAQYTGQGIPRDITSYVQISTSDRFTSITETNYYFWVSGTIDVPNVKNRTMAAVDVARLLQNPRNQEFAFFCPIQQTETNNSYMFVNVQEILSYQGSNVQLQYRISERDDEEHTQWQFFREGDPSSIVTDQYWNKMVDSLAKYTGPLPVTDEWDNAIIIANYLPWDIYGWDVAPWDNATRIADDPSSVPIYYAILEVPDPTLSEVEKYGIEYRPRQGMFRDLHMARKIFVQAGNELLKHIPIRDKTPGWADGITDEFWTYTNWYEIGYEDAIPTVVFKTLEQATIALTASNVRLAAGLPLLPGNISKDTVIQVIEGTSDGRYMLYVTIQPNPNVPFLQYNEIARENSAIKLLDTIYTTINKYALSLEIRQLLDAFRTEVMVDEFIVDQNELFFSMVNYVLSEQKTPDWVFKTSYISIKEDGLQLTQSQLYIPNQIDNITDYIIDVKPYHTQIRDYSTSYTNPGGVPDVAFGTACDGTSHIDYGDGTGLPIIDPDCSDIVPKWNLVVKFGPGDLIIDPLLYHHYILNAQTFVTGSQIFGSTVDTGDVPPITSNVDQYVSREDVYTVSLSSANLDLSKIGFSKLFPYTFTFDNINKNNPQTFITPYDIIGVQLDDKVLIYSQDYYVERNPNNTYTIYFFNDPSSSTKMIALVWFDGGPLLRSSANGYRNELAFGDATTNLTVNVDTKFIVNKVGNAIVPYTTWGDIWDSVDASTTLGKALIAAGAVSVPVSGGDQEIMIPWDAPLNPITTDFTISYKQNTNLIDGSTFYRNSNRDSGELAVELLAPTIETENIQVITIFVDPATHPLGTDILPDPTPIQPGVIWISGERIEYRDKIETVADTWELKLIRRGTMSTAPTLHPINSLVFVEESNIIPGSPNEEIWNLSSLPGIPNTTTQQSPNRYTSVTNVSPGGLWYANTLEADFLRLGPGKSVS